MTTDSTTDDRAHTPAAASDDPQFRRELEAVTSDITEEPTAGMVLHRVLAMAARTFLLNDMGDELLDETSRAGTVDALTLRMGTRPLWAQSAAEALAGTGRRQTQTERIHQSRVALRRIRSNLRTFRLALDPAWGTALRAELAWYGNRLGESRDLHILHEMLLAKGPDAIGPEQVARVEEVITAQTAETISEIATERGKARRFQLTEQMMVLWDGPEWKPKAQRPATEVLPPMLKRAWHDASGAARTARKDPSDANLHRLRIRVKDLRYGCETIALIEGSPARKTAKAAEALQGRLGDVHDVVFSIAWLETLAEDRPDLAEPVEDLILVQEGAGRATRKGWKKGMKEIERRWRRWHA